MLNPLIVVIDGRGGGIGRSIIEKLRSAFPQMNIVAIGTNPYASNIMLKAGATCAFFGEENLLKYTEKADIIMGVLGILIPNGLMGELTPTMVSAIGMSKAEKILIPMNKCGIKVTMDTLPLSHHIDIAVDLVKETIK